jgi:hypothetical protein
MNPATYQWQDSDRPVMRPLDAAAPLRLRHAVAGLHAGVIGAIAMVLWLMVGSVWHGRSIWVVPNLFASTFFGGNAYRNQLLITSWAGIALMIATYGVLGGVWGCVWREKKVRWLPLYGALAGVVAYFLLFDLLWRHVNPLVSLYGPDRQLQIAHVVWGMLLARSPMYARRISAAEAALPARESASFDPVAPEPARSDAMPSEPEVKSGEVIL